MAGDNRASEQPALAALHTIYLREHNRIVGELLKVTEFENSDNFYYDNRVVKDS